MFLSYFHKKYHPFQRLLAGFTAVAFSASLISAPSMGYAQTILNLPMPGTMVALSPNYTPVIMAGMTLYPDNPLQFDFIIDTGDDQLQGDELKKESQKLISYFMAALTVPEDKMWVNLSPYENDRIIADGLGQTVLGQDMLAQDYMLKQLSASMMYPDGETGKQFWQKVYQESKEKFGTTDIPTDTFNKIWIVPDKAVIYRKGTNIFVADSHLKVMLEEDYVALQHHDQGLDTKTDHVKPAEEAAKILREVVLPQIEKEVNEGKNFANLRQIYHALILATWYKTNLKESLLGQVYVNQNKTQGVETDDKDIKLKIYNQYLEAFKKGSYNYIKEDYDPESQQVISRKYFSGGEAFHKTDEAMSVIQNAPRTGWLRNREDDGSKKVSVAALAGINSPADRKVDTKRPDAAMMGNTFETIVQQVIPNVYSAPAILIEMFSKAAGSSAIYRNSIPSGNEFYLRLKSSFEERLSIERDNETRRTLQLINQAMFDDTKPELKETIVTFLSNILTGGIVMMPEESIFESAQGSIQAAGMQAYQQVINYHMNDEERALLMVAGDMLQYQFPSLMSIFEKNDVMKSVATFWTALLAPHPEMSQQDLRAITSMIQYVESDFKKRSGKIVPAEVLLEMKSAPGAPEYYQMAADAFQDRSEESVLHIAFDILFNKFERLTEEYAEQFASRMIDLYKQRTTDQDQIKRYEEGVKVGLAQMRLIRKNFRIPQEKRSVGIAVSQQDGITLVTKVHLNLFDRKILDDILANAPRINKRDIVPLKLGDVFVGTRVTESGEMEMSLNDKRGLAQNAVIDRSGVYRRFNERDAQRYIVANGLTLRLGDYSYGLDIDNNVTVFDESNQELTKTSDPQFRQWLLTTMHVKLKLYLGMILEGQEIPAVGDSPLYVNFSPQYLSVANAVISRESGEVIALGVDRRQPIGGELGPLPPGVSKTPNKYNQLTAQVGFKLAEIVNADTFAPILDIPDFEIPWKRDPKIDLAMKSDQSSLEVKPNDPATLEQFILNALNARMTRRGFISSAAAGAAAFAVAPYSARAQELPKVRVTRENVKEKLGEYVAVLSERLNQSSNPQLQNVAPLIAKMLDDIEFYPDQVSLPMAIKPIENEQGKYELDENNLINFRLYIEANTIALLLDQILNGSGEDQILSELILQSILVKEAAGLYDMNKNPEQGVSRLKLLTILKPDVQKLQALVSQNSNLLSPENIGSDRFMRLRELVKYVSAIFLHRETVGYIGLADFVSNQGISVERIKQYAQRMKTKSQNVYLLSVNIADYVRLFGPQIPDRVRLAAAYHMRAILQSARTAKVNMSHAAIYNLTNLVEIAERRIDAIQPGVAKDPIKADGTLQPRYIEYITDRKYSFVTPQQIDDLFGEQGVLRPESFSNIENITPQQESVEVASAAGVIQSLEDFTDTAQNAQSPEYGGIDFNANNLNLKTEGETIKFNLPENLRGIVPDAVNGVTPVIINITPIANFPLLLGLSQQNEDKLLTAQSM